MASAFGLDLYTMIVGVILFLLLLLCCLCCCCCCCGGGGGKKYREEEKDDDFQPYHYVEATGSPEFWSGIPSHENKHAQHSPHTQWGGGAPAIDFVEAEETEVDGDLPDAPAPPIVNASVVGHHARGEMLLSDSEEDDIVDGGVLSTRTLRPTETDLPMAQASMIIPDSSSDDEEEVMVRRTTTRTTTEGKSRPPKLNIVPSLPPPTPSVMEALNAGPAPPVPSLSPRASSPRAAPPPPVREPTLSSPVDGDRRFTVRTLAGEQVIPYAEAEIDSGDELI